MLNGCQADTVEHREGYVFGTRVDVSIYGQSKETAQTAIDAVLSEFDRLHHTYHAWQPSELSTLNAAIAQGQSTKVSQEMRDILQDAKTLSLQSEGLFNPAIGHLISLWGFQSDTFPPILPAENLVQQAREKQPGMADLIIEGDQIKSRNPAVQIDLGGYAKGYALDRAAQILKDKNIPNALINIGGNVLALGQKGKLPWRVGIQDPRAPRVLATLPLYAGEAIGTSGDYQRFFEVDGKRYCHILDPRTGTPHQHTASLTVLIPPQSGAGRLSDVASKPAFITGATGWRDALKPYQITQAMRIDAQGNIVITQALDQRVKWEDDSKNIQRVP